MRQKIIINLIFSVFFSLPLLGQSDEALKEMKRGDLLRETYCFEESFEAYQAAMAILEDSLNTNDDSLLKLQISDKLLMAENGRNMMGFVYKPEVITKHRFSLDDFFLYYPLPDSSWYSVPCQLDSLGESLPKRFMCLQEAIRSTGLRLIRKESEIYISLNIRILYGRCLLC